MIQELILNVTGQLRHPENKYRKEILGALRNRLLNVSEEPGILEGLQSIKGKLVEEWRAEEMIYSLLVKGKEKLIDFLSSPKIYEEKILPFLQKMLTLWKGNEDKNLRLEKWIQQQIFRLVDENHEKIGLLVKKNLDKLDNKTLISMMEDKIGKDLQWIRVNGALTGSLIGLVLVGIKMLLF